jgi:hypothetical protein
MFPSELDERSRKGKTFVNQKMSKSRTEEALNHEMLYINYAAEK